LAGVGREAGWRVECCDLTAEFCRAYCSPPAANRLCRAISGNDYAQVDALYFDWEDQFQSISGGFEHALDFRLLSGYLLRRFRDLPLARVVNELKDGTIHSPFLRQHVVPRLAASRPEIVGVTIASEHQVVPAIEVLQLVREVLPESYVLLGGNVVTRLRDSTAFAVLRSLADGVVVFQGELAFQTVLDYISEMGVKRARQELPGVMGHESIPVESWPTPSFDGLDLRGYVGISALPYVSTRGCYWGRCSFCAIPMGWSQMGYAGSAPAEFVVKQLVRMGEETGVPRFKFVDEAMPPAKARRLGRLLSGVGSIEWEAYARLEPAWEEPTLLHEAAAGGLRKLYFGLEQAPSTDRLVLNKNDRGNITRIMRNCREAGVKVHAFCMVGYPGTGRADALATASFLVDHADVIDTADLVGFRLERGKAVPGTRPNPTREVDWRVSVPFVPTEMGVLCCEEVQELEGECQELLWERAPRLLHPLYRVVSPWGPDGLPAAMGSTVHSSQDVYATDR
jgi:hypothetical protein